MATNISIRTQTENHLVFDYTKEKLLPGEYETDRRDYANISGALETVAIGTVMGIVTATGKMVPFDSTAVDGSENPEFILLSELTDIAIAGTVDGVLVVVGGEIDASLVKFQNGTDTLATTVEVGGVTKSVKDWLRTNGNDFRFLSVTDVSKHSNE